MHVLGCRTGQTPFVLETVVSFILFHIHTNWKGSRKLDPWLFKLLESVILKQTGGQWQQGHPESTGGLNLFPATYKSMHLHEGSKEHPFYIK